MSEPEHRDSLTKMVAEIREDTSSIKQALFGTPEDPSEGFIPRTKEKLGNHGTRIKRVEERVWIWLGVLAVLGPLFVVVMQKYIFSAVVK